MYFWCQFLDPHLTTYHSSYRRPNYCCVQYRHLCLKWSFINKHHPTKLPNLLHIHPHRWTSSIHLIWPPIYSSMLVIRLPTADGRWMLGFTPNLTRHVKPSPIHLLRILPSSDQEENSCSLLFLFWVVFGVAKWLRKVEHTTNLCILEPLFVASLRRHS